MPYEWSGIMRPEFPKMLGPHEGCAFCWLVYQIDKEMKLTDGDREKFKAHLEIEHGVSFRPLSP